MPSREIGVQVSKVREITLSTGQTVQTKVTAYRYALIKSTRYGARVWGWTKSLDKATMRAKNHTERYLHTSGIRYIVYDLELDQEVRSYGT